MIQLERKGNTIFGSLTWQKVSRVKLQSSNTKQAEGWFCWTRLFFSTCPWQPALPARFWHQLCFPHHSFGSSSPGESSGSRPSCCWSGRLGPLANVRTSASSATMKWWGFSFQTEGHTGMLVVSVLEKRNRTECPVTPAFSCVWEQPFRERHCLLPALSNPGLVQSPKPSALPTKAC